MVHYHIGVSRISFFAKYYEELSLLTQIYQAELTTAGNNAEERLRIEEAFQKAKLELQKKYNLETKVDNRNFLERWNDDMQEWLK